MSYTKAQMVDQIYLLLAAGQPTEDFDIQREDISVYLPNAINTESLIDSRRRRQEARRDNVGSSGVDAAFLRVEFLTVEEDTNVGQKYVEFIVKPLLMDNTYGIAEVGPKKGDRVFVKINNRHDGVRLDYLFEGVTRWYYENNQGSQRIYFKNIPDIVDQIRVAYVPSVDDLKDDDIIPIPSGLETLVLDRAVKFFLTMSEREADDMNNSNDDRSKQ